MKTKMQKLFKDETEKTLVQLFRYTFVGGAAFLVDIGSLFILTQFFGIYYLISAAIAFILGLITNYALSISWVFNKRTLGSMKLEFGVFALIGFVGLGLNEVLIWFLTENVHIYYLVSKIIAAILILFWNFFARKFTLFK
ncbi:MAG: GtrA family protein [Methanobacterium paludis]|uniref:GtrA family protein n=1 Tax=Methanobacterium paludis (strain DSM 25820 / JCM 18151 / SWAN1) TaxID=868131 RepID=F6D2I9_METPW|nr:GtrA family protein [Methanobacterium paludis]AEG17346.1 GtrA family protein [Methanobacterium paludis]MCE7699023.1 GtrA family protein [Methanobacterium paludis]